MYYDQYIHMTHSKESNRNYFDVSIAQHYCKNMTVDRHIDRLPSYTYISSVLVMVARRDNYGNCEIRQSNNSRA